MVRIGNVAASKKKGGVAAAVTASRLNGGDLELAGVADAGAEFRVTLTYTGQPVPRVLSD